MIGSNPNTFLALELDFGSGGNSCDFQRSGWSFPETGHTWALGSQATLKLPIIPDTKTSIVVFDLGPFTDPPRLQDQGVVIRANGRMAFSGRVSERVLVGFAVRHTMRTVEIEIEFDFSHSLNPLDAGIGGDTRRLAMDFHRAWLFSCTDEWPVLSPISSHCEVEPSSANMVLAVERATGLSPQDLLGRFESLGHSCDFGLAQRAIGIEPLGLLRFGGTSTRDAFRGLIRQYEGIGGDAIRASVPPPGNEYWVHETKYGIHFHTFVHPDKETAEQIIAREIIRLPFLRRKFLEDLKSGEKIFILRRPEPVVDHEALAVWAALNHVRPNVLLYVDPSGRRRPGTVEHMGPRLLRGHIEGAIGSTPLSVATWLSVCANAYQLIREKNYIEGV